MTETSGKETTEIAGVPQKKWKAVLSAAVFCLVFAVSFVAAGRILKPHYDLTDCFHWEEDSLDVVFLGSSHVYLGIQPMQLWKDHGIASYDASSGAQTIPFSYYVLREVLRTQHPKLVVLDSYFMCADPADAQDHSLREVTDAMDMFSPIRQECLSDLLPKIKRKEKLWTFYFTFGVYHTRWEELTRKDFLRETDVLRGAKIRWDHNPVIVPEMQEVPRGILDVNMDYFERIVRLCREEGAEFLLISIPFTKIRENPEEIEIAMAGELGMVKSLELYTEEHGIDMLNCFRLKEVLSFDEEKDFRDKDHLNTYGALKLTDYLGKYLKENYRLPDHRGEEKYASWDADLEEYEKQIMSPDGK